MNFFESQDAAQRGSRWLLLLFVLAIASIVLLVNLAIYVILKFQTLGAFEFDLELAIQIAGGVLVLVLAGSLYRIYSLKRGGEVIAAALGGHLVVPGGGNEHEQRLVNVVEEMAIASGLPVPAVYLHDEDGINAYAAGYNSGDAVIGVTRGALLNLNRDELQGVIAHEFSHILNGDMRLNIRLVGVLHGILMLSILGRLLLEAKPGVARRTSSAFPVMFIGLSMFLIGYMGKFFGDLIKAGVSRQREFLADASAVQFTRNPGGIAGALKRIGGHAAGANVRSTGAEEFSHLYFSNAFSRAFIQMLATHPPLAERIKRIEPNWDGEFQFRMPVTDMATASPGVQGFAAGGAVAAGTPEDQVGQLSPERIAVAADLIHQIPSGIREALYETYSVRAVVYLLFLHPHDEALRDQQMTHLNQQADLFVRARMRELGEPFKGIDPALYLPLLELALPALRQLGSAEYQRLMNNLKFMQQIGQPLSLSNWARYYYLKHHLHEAFGEVSHRDGHQSAVKEAASIGYLMSVLAYGGRTSQLEAPEAFEAGAAVLAFDVTLTPRQQVSSGGLERAVQRVASIRPLQKPRILKAFTAVVEADQRVSIVESEMMRCIADAIDCPMPPLGINT